MKPWIRVLKHFVHIFKHEQNQWISPEITDEIRQNLLNIIPELIEEIEKLEKEIRGGVSV